MRRLILLVLSLIVAVSSYAGTQYLTHSSLLSALASAWKAKQLTHPIQNQNDITIVYGGADISRRPTLAFHSTTV